METAAGAARARPGRRDLPRGHAHPRGLARPSRSAASGRLALESGAPVVPIAITGSRARPRRLADPAGQGARALRRPAHLPARRGPVAVPRRRGDRAHLALRRAPVGVARRPAAAAHRRRGRRRARWAPRSPSVLARAGLEVQLGCRTAAQAERLRGERENAALPAGRGARRARSSCSTVPRDRVRRRGPRRARRAVQQPARRRRRDRRARRRAQRRAGGLEGPRAAARHHAHGLRGRARPRPRGRRASAVPRTRARRSRWARRWSWPPATATCAASSREVLDAGGLTVEATDDVTGAELAACAKNAAALASAAAAAARRQPRRRRRRPGLLRGARAGASRAAAAARPSPGLAGAGDLVATAIAEGSRNRRAGELVGRRRAGRPGRGRRAADRRVARHRAAARPRRSRARASTRRSPTGLRQRARRRGVARAVARERAQREPEAAHAAPPDRAARGG